MLPHSSKHLPAKVPTHGLSHSSLPLSELPRAPPLPACKSPDWAAGFLTQFSGLWKCLPLPETESHSQLKSHLSTPSPHPVPATHSKNTPTPTQVHTQCVWNAHVHMCAHAMHSHKDNRWHVCCTHSCICPHMCTRAHTQSCTIPLVSSLLLPPRFLKCSSLHVLSPPGACTCDLGSTLVPPSLLPECTRLGPQTVALSCC